MDALAAYGGGSSGSSDEEDNTGEPPIDPKESVSVLSKLKEKFPLKSAAPNVPNRVSNNWKCFRNSQRGVIGVIVFSPYTGD